MRAELEAFVLQEARLLDERRFAEWLALFAEDGVYWVPTLPGQASPQEALSLFHEPQAAARDARGAPGGHGRAHPGAAYAHRAPRERAGGFRRSRSALGAGRRRMARGRGTLVRRPRAAPPAPRPPKACASSSSAWISSTARRRSVLSPFRSRKTTGTGRACARTRAGSLPAAGATRTTCAFRGCCTPAFLRSPYPHARIVSLRFRAGWKASSRPTTALP